MPTNNEIVVRRFYEALSTGDTALVDEALAADWEAVPPLRTGCGPEGWKASIAHLRGVFSDLTVEFEAVVANGDMVAVRAVNRARHTGELLGVEGTGREVEFRAADFHRVVGGRIVRTWHLEDYFAIATQIGPEFTRGA
ncbi:Predicted ester cyclase [Streptomyces sp. BpilaLS-43]|uniref:ester cyclase n=1 Tax=Streptomyces sp. BpilaLS-43 TaxID=1839778 RepID=UPI00081AF035|nr:ester cyclase [Streptomyces sp. BpilaLS-43]SCD54810.1 Predicted ester cyclase [Streptomyces sp. BpilaLS-43]